MLFNVSGLVQEGIGATRTYPVEGLLVTDGRDPEQVSGTVELLRTMTGVLVRADIDVAESETCSRCLKPLQTALHLQFEEEFQQTVDAHGALTAERPAEDVFVIDDLHTLDITEAVRQYREAAAEIQPLCRQDCRGLCPVCGGDLNEQACRCQDAVADPRWGALAGFREMTEGGGAEAPQNRKDRSA